MPGGCADNHAMTRCAPFHSIVSCLLAASGLVAAAPSGAGVATEAVWLRTNVPDLYPRDAEICISTYEQMRDAPGVVLKLQSAIEGFSHFRYTLQRDAHPAEPFRASRGGVITVGFESGDSKPRGVVVVAQAVSKTGRKTKPYTIEFRFLPKEMYAATGQKTSNWLVVHDSDLALCGTSVGDWIVDRPSDEDMAYARRRWARLLKPLDSEYDKAQAIARELVRSLRSHEGIPSDRMRYVPGLEQLARAEAGQDRVWCGNYADIFSAACNAMDIPVRKIDMQYVWSAEGKTTFEIAEGHRTTEVFDRSLDRWIWMDLTFGLLGAHTEDHGPLNMADLVQALNDEYRLARLQLLEYDPDQGRERIVSVEGSLRGKDLFRFFRPDQRYKYARRATAPRP
jgi:Transglutaminase-like superfamily